ncbi:hypothetical protein KSP40_PGU017321 [Platanthera guangdongensis]|uniref:Uncharacterized protein n=1 Tax=Platanthera guangdongensis TaxID=2320717 RepID=A0ABR2MUC8_9ASPA
MPTHLKASIFQLVSRYLQASTRIVGCPHFTVKCSGVHSQGSGSAARQSSGRPSKARSGWGCATAAGGGGVPNKP